MRIRRATARDAAILAPLFAAYHAFYRRKATARQVQPYLRARLRRREAVVFVAETGRGALCRAVGFTLLYPTFSSLRMKRTWVLNDLFVAPEGRRLGVARALMARARAHAKRTGAAYLMLETEETNRPAQRLYESLGWHREPMRIYELEIKGTG